MTEEKNLNIKNLCLKLQKKYGNPQGQWSLWCKRPKNKKEKEEVIVGAILTQRTNWKNVEKAIENLKRENLIDIEKLSKISQIKLENLIRPCGFYKVKAERLRNVARWIAKNWNFILSNNLKTVRKKMLDIKGLGPETVDSILLYAFEKPIFVIDEYTRRLCKKEKLTDKFSYDYLQKLFEKNLPSNAALYQDIHALIVIDGKTDRKTLIFPKNCDNIKNERI